jgi:hypothetical protein
MNGRGVPMAFAAQIDTSSLPGFDAPWELATPWKHQGMLFRFFTDLLEDPVEPGPALALETDPRGPLTRTPAPQVPDPFPPGGRLDDWEYRDELYRLPETVVELLPFLTVPETHTTLHPDSWDDSPTADRYEEWAARVRLDGETDGPPYPYQLQHLLGEPMSVQDDVRLFGAMFNRDPFWANVLGRPMDRALTTPDAWAVLLGLHADHEFGLRIHDGGAIHLLAPVADLADGRLDRLVCSVDSG